MCPAAILPHPNDNRCTLFAHTHSESDIQMHITTAIRPDHVTQSKLAHAHVAPKCVCMAFTPNQSFTRIHTHIFTHTRTRAHARTHTHTHTHTHQLNEAYSVGTILQERCPTGEMACLWMCVKRVFVLRCAWLSMCVCVCVCVCGQCVHVSVKCMCV